MLGGATGGQQFYTLSGAIYTADASGNLNPANLSDQKDLIASGVYPGLTGPPGPAGPAGPAGAATAGERLSR